MPHSRQVFLVGHHQAVVLTNPDRSWFHVIVENVAVGLFLYSEDVLAQHARFFCDRCGHPSGSRRQMVRHVVTCHYFQACHEQGALMTTSLRVGIVHSHERRVRLPWRVRAPEYD